MDEDLLRVVEGDPDAALERNPDGVPGQEDQRDERELGLEGMARTQCSRQRSHRLTTYPHDGVLSHNVSSRRRYHRRMMDESGKTLDQRLEEIGAQLAWVRDYL